MGLLRALFEKLRYAFSLVFWGVKKLVTISLIAFLVLFVVFAGVQYVQTGGFPAEDSDTGQSAPDTMDLDTTTPPRAETVANPWNQDTLVVAVEDRTNSTRDFESLVSSALEYWEAHDDDYAAYTVSFELRPQAENPDVVVSFRENVVCDGFREMVAGCAPVLNSSSPPPVPAVVRVEAGMDDQQTLETLKHEFGHVLGIRHCRKPMPLMSGACR